jgi:hypothetical protein
MKISVPYFDQKQCVNVWLLGCLGYQTASRIQQLLASRHFQPKQTVEPNTIILVEHPPGV